MFIWALTYSEFIYCQCQTQTVIAYFTNSNIIWYYLSNRETICATQLPLLTNSYDLVCGSCCMWPLSSFLDTSSFTALPLVGLCEPSFPEVIAPCICSTFSAPSLLTTLISLGLSDPDYRCACALFTGDPWSSQQQTGEEAFSCFIFSVIQASKWNSNISSILPGSSKLNMCCCSLPLTSGLCQCTLNVPVYVLTFV